MQTGNSQNFITVNGRQFELDGQPYYFIGANFWYGANLGSQGEGGDRQRLLRELDRFQAMGVSNLRIMAASEGPNEAPWRMTPAMMVAPDEYDEAVLDGLDFLLAEMGKRNIRAVMCLNNFWAWSGGMAQYVNWVTGKPIPYPDPEQGGWTKYSFYTAQFYGLKEARALYLRHIERLIMRRNTYTGRLYRDDPTVFSWQLCNEPRGMLRFGKYKSWVNETAAFIKKLDTNHLLSVGSEGRTPYPVFNRFRSIHRDKNIDYCTFHLWVQNWGWYDPLQAEKSFDKAIKKAKRYFDHHLKVANAIRKPIVLEEFGMARDNNDHHASAPVKWRNNFYRTIFGWVHEEAQKGSAMAGANLWAWGGEGRPRSPQAIWQRGDDWIGDPPHEYQGWYSIYAADTSTIAVIHSFALMMKQL